MESVFFMAEVRSGDLERLARAVWLDVTRLDPGRFRVSGGARPHQVRIGKGYRNCDCADFALNGQSWCKHALAVALRQGHPGVLRGLRKLIAQPKRGRRTETPMAGAGSK